MGTQIHISALGIVVPQPAHKQWYDKLINVLVGDSEHLSHVMSEIGEFIRIFPFLVFTVRMCPVVYSILDPLLSQWQEKSER